MPEGFGNQEERQAKAARAQKKNGRADPLPSR